MLSIPVTLLLSRLDVHLPTKCSVMKGILNIFSLGSLCFMNSFRGSISGEWLLLLGWLKYLSAIPVKCLLKILAMSASRVYTLLSCIIDVIFTAFWVWWLSSLNTLANILGLGLYLLMNSVYKLFLASRIKNTVLFLHNLYSASCFFFFALSRVFIATRMSLVIQGGCVALLIRFVTMGKCLFSMLEYVEINVSKHSSVV